MNKLFISTATFGCVDETPLDKLAKYGIDFAINPNKRKLLPEETAALAADSAAVIVGTEDLTPLVESSEKLKFICRLGVGIDTVPFELCREKGIRISYTPDAVTPGIAELTIALMLASVRNLCWSDKNIRSGNWQGKTGLRLGSSTIGLIGFGRVGQRVAKLLASFEPEKVLVYDIQYDEEKIAELSSSGLNIQSSNLDDLFKAADVLSLHVDLNQSTQNLISAPQLKTMKKKSILVNTSRGGVVNEKDLYTALKGGVIYAAALDVFEKEPYSGPLTELANVVLSPHQGSATRDCRAKMEKEAVDEVIRFFNGETLKQEVLN